MRSWFTETFFPCSAGRLGNLLAASLAASLGWTSLSYAGQPGRETEPAQAPIHAVAKANKSMQLAPGHASIRSVSFNAFAQNEANATPQQAPPAQKQPPAKPSTTKPDTTSKPPATPAATQDSKKPASPADSTQTPNPAPPEPLTPFSSLQSPSGQQQPFLNNRLSRTPDIFGDSFIPLSAGIDLGGLTGMTNLNNADTDIPIGGGMRRFKNEHARALPTDRVFVLYNHFHNALELRANNQSTTNSVDQFTFGFEKTSEDELWSFEVRMPFSGEADLSAGGTNVQADGVGNLVATLKRLLYSDSTFAAALGLAVVAPTGSDASVTVDNSDVRIDFENKSTHLLPYLAVQITPDDNWFFHAFCQVDAAANRNDVTLTVGNITETDSLADQTLLYLDASAGYWWYRANDDEGLTGLASVVELHYTTALENADVAELSGVEIGNFENRFDVLNLTAGVHSEWNGNSALRVAIVVPLDRDERFFDSEVQVSFIRRFR